MLASTNCTYRFGMPSTREPMSSSSSFVCHFLSRQDHQRIPSLFESMIHDLDHCNKLVNVMPKPVSNLLQISTYHVQIGYALNHIMDYSWDYKIVRHAWSSDVSRDLEHHYCSLRVLKWVRSWSWPWLTMLPPPFCQNFQIAPKRWRPKPCEVEENFNLSSREVVT